MGGRLRCDPSEPRYCWTKLCDCEVCPVALELYGPPPEPSVDWDDPEPVERSANHVDSDTHQGHGRIGLA